MKKEETIHFQTQFNRQNLKYNRLWNQLSSLTLFFIGTLFILIHYIISSVPSNKLNYLLMALLLAFFTAFCGALIWSEMSDIKENIDGILQIFEEDAFGK